MAALVNILLPIFGLILAGYLARRAGVVGPTGASELNRVVVWLALPCLLFDIMAHATWAELDQPGFALAFGISCAAVFVLTLVGARLAGERHLVDASVEAVAASYPNVGFIGIPLCALVFGGAGMMPATIATILVVCVLASVAVVVIEVGLQQGRSAREAAVNVGRSLVRNPIIVAPVAGVLFAASGLTVPVPAESFLKMLGAAASPCALVCLGLFLANSPAPHAVTPRAEAARARSSRPASRRIISRGALALTGAKLFLQPLLTWWLAARVFALPTLMTEAAVLLAALPTGTGPFMLAEFYRREAGTTSRTILWSTVGSLVSLTVILGLMGKGH